MKRIRIPYWPLLILPWLSYGFGYMCNAITVAANRGVMPVLMPNCKVDPDDTAHACMTVASHLKWLSDWAYVPQVGWYSTGDFFLWAGASTWEVCLLLWIALIIRDAN